MSLTVKSLLALGLFTVFAACSQQEEEVIIDAPIIEEPTSNKF